MAGVLPLQGMPCHGMLSLKDPLWNNVFHSGLEASYIDMAKPLRSSTSSTFQRLKPITFITSFVALYLPTRLLTQCRVAASNASCGTRGHPTVAGVGPPPLLRGGDV
eukprot:CAMPEP_0195575814 /NCGR_PEP_ID=MMETSP0814-20130614/7945_1 /TAXON_ID=97485 /ORGANISM="Prymnesium parvum, Strain Texoma1" /LENGTH=106 /DNA_ID=CAMNT_0040712023 /DNA_START=523 /DNA_END=844 /DNA_ORIENTATION=-